MNVERVRAKREELEFIAEHCSDTLLAMMEKGHDIGAINSTYNLSCSTYGMSVLIRKRVHVKCLKLMSYCKNVQSSCAYLHLLVRMSLDSTCVLDMINKRLIRILMDALERDRQQKVEEKQKSDLKDLSEKDIKKDSRDDHENKDGNATPISNNGNLKEEKDNKNSGTDTVRTYVRTDASRLLIAVVSSPSASVLTAEARKKIVGIVNSIAPDLTAETTDEGTPPPPFICLDSLPSLFSFSSSKI